MSVVPASLSLASGFAAVPVRSVPTYSTAKASYIRRANLLFFHCLQLIAIGTTVAAAIGAAILQLLSQKPEDDVAVVEVKPSVRT